MDPVLRTWTFWIQAFVEDECRSDMEHLVCPRMRQAPGNRRACALFHNAGDGTIQVTVMSLWDSMAHIQAFAGPDYLQPTILPAHLAKVFDREPCVHHYATTHLPPAFHGWLSA